MLDIILGSITDFNFLLFLHLRDYTARSAVLEKGQIDTHSVYIIHTLIVWIIYTLSIDLTFFGTADFAVYVNGFWDSVVKNEPMSKSNGPKSAY